MGAAVVLRPGGVTRPDPGLANGAPQQSKGISSRLVVLLAAACGVSVANLYYAQPLLHTIAGSLRTSSGTAGLVVTFSQAGYAIGLALVLPVGDIMARRRLVPVVLVLAASALAASAVAPSIAALVALALLVGLGSVAAQILVPLAAHLADDANRGRVVGQVMSGLLLGILLARTLSGIVAGLAGWRVVYWLGAALAVLLALALSRALPPEDARPAIGYGVLLRSTFALLLAEPLLRRRSVFGALGFAGFSVFWTTAAFLLAGPPYHYGVTVIGLFGLVGAAGALCATVAGRLADQGRTAGATAAFSVAILASFGLMWFGRGSLGWLVVGIVLLDIGVQGLQVTNQSLVYTLAPEARSRVNSAYMFCYFIGGAAGSAVAADLYGAGGWAAVCALGAAIGLVATLGSALDALRPARSGPLATRQS